MADRKISQFADGGPIQTTDEIATNRSGVNTKVFVGSAAALDVGNSVGDIVAFQNDGSGNPQYPQADGSLITNISGLNLQPETMVILNSFAVLPPQSRILLIDETVSSLKNYGIWEKLDLLYFTAAHDSQAAGINWISPALNSLTAFNNPAFSQDRGYTGNGVDAYLSPGLNFSQLAEYQQDSGSLFGWVNGGSDTTTDNDNRLIGATGSAAATLLPRGTASGMAGRVNSNTSVTTTGIMTNRGFSLVNRVNSTQQQLWKNGIKLNTGSQSSVSPPASTISFLRLQSGYATIQFAMVGIGGGLTDQEAENLYDISRNYLEKVYAIPPDYQAAIDGAAKFYINFNGTGTVSIRDSLNVTSITDNGTGLYTVNIDQGFSNGNWSASVSSNQPVTLISSQAAGTIQVRTQNSSFSDTDASIVCVQGFGD